MDGCSNGTLFLDSCCGGGFLDATMHSSYSWLSLMGRRNRCLILLSLFVLLRMFGHVINKHIQGCNGETYCSDSRSNFRNLTKEMPCGMSLLQTTEVL